MGITSLGLIVFAMTHASLMLTITCISMVKGITGSGVGVTFYRCLIEVMVMDPGFRISSISHTTLIKVTP